MEALTTLGVKVSYCVETTKGERPLTDYIKLTGIKSTPDMNVSPSSGDTTTFDNTEYTTHVELLKEMPDSLEFGAIFSQQLYEEWDTLVQAYDTAKKAQKGVWFCIDIPDFDKSIFFLGKPSKLGLPALESNSVIEISLYIVPYGEPKYEADPSYKAKQ